ncbi:hypothetical protein Anas_08406 [Armadillidium nasatum]|uniref:Uncharacterized protein n=1 Tax=Armadillidium nasatum TaxID=96803 RepID=A0A5N5SXW1_9CRUS|nr:hypothetical protein Anas_08406 [Armadillidium nasatum]
MFLVIIASYLKLAQVRLQQRHYPVSEALLRDVLKSSPNNRQALYHLSLLFATTNRSYESIQTATKAASGCSTPRDFCAFLHAHLADLLHTNAMLELAVQNYRKALDLEPSLLKAHLNLGAIYHTQVRHLLTCEAYVAAYIQQVNCLQTHPLIAAIRCSNTSNYSHAWEHYSEALKLEPSNAILLENIYKLQRVFKISSESALEDFKVVLEFLKTLMSHVDPDVSFRYSLIFILIFSIFEYADSEYF